MRRYRLLLPLLALLAGCDGGPPIPETDLRLTVVSGAEPVAPGQGFPLTVVRVWDKTLLPSEWSDAVLSPLVLRLVDATRREDGARVEETRRYRAYAFGLGDVLVPAPTFVARPRAGGLEQRVAADGLRIRVRPAVDPEAPGTPEIPDDLLEERARWGPWALGGAALTALVLAAILVRRRRRAPPSVPSVPVAGPPPETPDAAALRALAGLRTDATDAPDGLRATFSAASDVVRTYVGLRFGVRAMERTSEELLRETPAGGASGASVREGLRGVLAPCDAVKFANVLPSLEARAHLFAAAEGFVRATAAGGAASGPAVRAGERAS